MTTSILFTSPTHRSRFAILKGRASMVAVASTFIAVIVLVGLLGPLLMRTPAGAIDVTARFLPPVWSGGSWDAPLGTDALGRDLFVQLVYGARNSTQIAGIVTIGAGILGTVMGLLSGFFGGLWDRVIGRLVEAQLSLPLIVVALALIVSFGASTRTLLIAMILATWVPFARIVRAEARTLRNGEMVRLSRVSGLTDLQIVWRHILRNVSSSVIVLLSITFGEAIVLEASLSFLSLGVQPPGVSWGLMIAEARQYIGSNPWVVIAPSLVLGLTALSSNILGDHLRDRLDPSLRRRS